MRPVLFLDFDDVICLNKPFGGYEAIHAISRLSKEPDLPPTEYQKLWEQLFDASAKAYLKALHDEFLPWYVLSTSWWWLLDKNALVSILTKCGLQFVADNLHPSWATPKRMQPDIRAREISNWQGANPGFEDLWVVLDDELSGTGFADWPIQAREPFIVLCKENVGLTEVEFEKLRNAFQLRTKFPQPPEGPDAGKSDI